MNFLQRLRKLFTGTSPSSDAEPDLYEGKDFLSGYIAHTNARVAEDPQAAIGGKWDEIGPLQFEFLKKMGLMPQHRMLDLGCGTLRGGRHFIRYLDASRYTGIDISPACIESAGKLLREEGLVDKQPRLILNTSRNLKFDEFGNDRFDFILAQSVFTHLPADLIAECLENVHKVLSPQGAFYFTYWKDDSYKQIGVKDFAYPWEFFVNLAETHGLQIDEVSASYPHPRDQRMGVVRRAQ